MLVKEEDVAVAGDDGDDDDARSCDSIRWGACLCGCVGLVVVEGGVWCGV